MYTGRLSESFDRSILKWINLAKNEVEVKMSLFLHELADQHELHIRNIFVGINNVRLEHYYEIERIKMYYECIQFC